MPTKEQLQKRVQELERRTTNSKINSIKSITSSRHPKVKPSATGMG